MLSAAGSRATEGGAEADSSETPHDETPEDRYLREAEASGVSGADLYADESAGARREPGCLGDGVLAGQGASDRAPWAVSAPRRRCARALRAAPGRLEGSKTCPLVLLQQTAQLGVLRSERSLKVTHGAFVLVGRCLTHGISYDVNSFGRR